MEALPPEPTEPLTGRFMLGRLCKSLANCGVICLLKYLCGFEVMRGGIPASNLAHGFSLHTETIAHMLYV